MKKFTSLVRQNSEISVPPSKKLKRSASADLYNSKNITIPSCGLFDRLPLELKFKLFTYLSISDLGVLTITSKQLRTLVELYTGSHTCKHLAQLYTPHMQKITNSKKKENIIQLYKQIGFLYKRSTILYSTSIRINMVEQILKRHACAFTGDDCCPVQCPSLSLFGHFLRVFLSGWEEVERHKVFHSLIHVCFGQNFWRKFTTLIYTPPGSLPEEELQVRLFLRRVFLDANAEPQLCLLDNSKVFTPLTSGGQDCAKAVMRILKSWPIIHQARILFNLYGPLHKGMLMWRAMCENTAADAEQVRACFGELGWVFRLLHTSNLWTDDDAISVLDELTALPEDWLAENVACLLYTAGQRISSQMIASKAVNGRAAELAVTLTSLCLVQVKVRAGLSSVLELVEQACKAASSLCDKRQFLDQLSRAFQDVIIDLYETDEIDNRLEDFSTLLRAQADFVRALLGRVYEE